MKQRGLYKPQPKTNNTNTNTNTNKKWQNLSNSTQRMQQSQLC